MRVAQFPRQFGVARASLAGEVEQRLQPEIGEGEYLVALLHEPNGQDSARQRVVGSQFGGGARQQHRLPPPARRDDQDVLARRRIEVIPNSFENDVEFMAPDCELRDHVLVGLEKAGIELADRGGARSGHRSVLRALFARRLARDT